MQLQPFLKWAGGKRWFASSCSDLFPKRFDRLIEPFCGSAAVFFSLAPKSAILADANYRLIETYRVVRDFPALFEVSLARFAREHSQDFYYRVRGEAFDNEIERAAQFVYLNRVCFNGIYRENLRGVFNVPLGSKQNVILDTDDFSAVSKALQCVDLRAGDFEEVIKVAGRGDFLFVDPPYTVKHNNNGFVKYNQKIFSWEDQIRLAASVKSAADRGSRIVVTNADHPDVRDLYSDVFSVLSVNRATVIASKNSSRGTTTEMVATNVS